MSDNRTAHERAQELVEHLSLPAGSLDYNLIATAIMEAEEAQKARHVQLCLNEYARWRDADNDKHGICVGAIGAVANVVCAIEGIPTVSGDEFRAAPDSGLRADGIESET